MDSPDALVPQWPVPPGVQALCSTRDGGVSAPPWDSLNLGDHVGDAPDAVAANRQRWASRLGARPVYLRQVHGCGVVRLQGDEPDGLEADACWTDQRGIACTIMVADCLPVLLCESRHGRATRVGAAHAGWRGLAGEGGAGVLEALMARFDPAHTVAWLGPCIGPQAFEVGPEVRAAFVAADAGCASLFRAAAPSEADRSINQAGTASASGKAGKYLADLPGLARRRLAALGVTRVHGNDGGTPWCTVANPSRFFSHRRDRASGRLAASVWLA